jgi:2,4-dienoyl-CoA reductase-like NADH-dependent reductase (Old Yellow Enzyme family)
VKNTSGAYCFIGRSIIVKILNSIKIKNVDFKNRIVMSPMVPFGLPPCRDGIMGDELLHHYLQRVSSGMGLMIC